MSPEQDITQALERELQKNRRSRNPEVANAAGSACTSSSMNLPTPLLKLLVECCSLNSPRNKGSFPSSGTSGGSSPAQSASSDSSISCRLNSRTTERRNRMTAGLHRSAPVAQQGPLPTPNSPMPLSAPNAGRGTSAIPTSATVARVGRREPASTTIARIAGRAPVRVPKKRKRKSKKPPTKIVKATMRNFRATVQDLTGCKDLPVPVIRPQPHPPQPERRPHANAVPVDMEMDMDMDSDSCNQPARPESPLISMIRPLRSSAPTVAFDRAPPPTFEIYDSDTSVPSWRKSPSLNHCMEYDEEATPYFLNSQTEDYDEKLGWLREDSRHHPVTDSVRRHTSDPKHEHSTTAASSSRESFPKAEPLDLNSESQRKELSTPGHMCSQSGGNHDISSASSIPIQFTNQPPVFGFGTASTSAEEQSGFENMDLEFWMLSGAYSESFLDW